MDGRLDVSVIGSGPAVLFIHGSAVDQGTWSLQRTRLHRQLTLLLYDRRGTNGAGGVTGATPVSIAQHADDAAAILEPHAPALVCGSSFGAVVALELVRRHPQHVRQAVLLEPPLGPEEMPDPGSFAALARFDQIAASEGGPAAGAFFFREILGEDAFLRIGGAYRQRAEARWQEIRRDWAALLDYRPRYESLRTVTTPIQLIGGERSHPRFGRTLRVLKDSLPNATLEFLPCGHTIQAEAHRAFNAKLLALATGGGTRGEEEG